MTKTSKFLSRRARFTAGVAPVVLGVALLSQPAFAQDVEAQDVQQPSTGPVENTTPGVSAQGDPDDGVIVVTGSRIPQPNLTATSPVTVINSQEIKLQGTTRTEDLINTLPQAFASFGGNLANGATGTATVNLRGLGSARTLVLINGRRLLPGDPVFPAPDINAVPSALVERVDVLTGGASSVYGSDAVSGVVNFIMDTDFEGFKLDGQYSFFQHQNNNDTLLVEHQRDGYGIPRGSVADGGTVDVTATIGASFDDGRGHVVAYVGYRDIEKVTQDRRDYSSCAANSRTPAQVTATPDRIFDCGGSATSGVGTFFTNFATLQTGPNRTFIPGFTPYNFAPTNYFQRPDERYVAGAFAEYEISDAIQPYLEFMFMDDRTVAQIAPSGNFFNTTSINCDNPLLSAQQLAIACAPDNLVGFAEPVVDDPTTPVDETDPGSAATVFIDQNGNPYFRGVLQPGRRNVEGGPRQDDLQHTNFRTVAGVRGDLNSAFSYDAYYLFGRVNFAQTYRNDFSVTRLTRALDVVTGPTGQPVCRSVLDGTDPNCVPYDIFALNSVSPQAVAYLQIPGFARAQVEQQVASASVTGLLGEYGVQSPWADEGVGLNVGVEYRKEKLNYETDSAFQTGDLAGQGAPSLPTRGAFDVKEVFGEVRIPIVTDSFFHALSVGAGYRYSKYDNGVSSFSTDTYKFEVDFSPIQDIRFRASYNRAVRAPNIQELFAPQRVALNGSSDPCAGDLDATTEAAAPTATAAQCALTGVLPGQYGNIVGNIAGQYNGLIGGDPTLDPETATTYTAGVVLQPRFLPGFAATIDYFNIEIEDTIQQIGQDTIIDTCINTGDAAFCDLINRDASGSLWLTSNGFVQDLTTNIGSVKTSGVDFGVSYSTDISDDIGSVSFNMVGTWLDELITDNGVSDPYDCTGFYGLQCTTPNPEWRFKARLTYTTPQDIGISLQWRFFDSVEIDRASSNPTLAGPFAPANAKIPSQSYFDLATTFRVTDNYTFRLGVNNLFDKDPPIVGSGTNATTNGCSPVFCSGNTYPQVYDALGRYIFAGVTLDF